MWWLYLIKFIACVIAIFSTILFFNSLVASMFNINSVLFESDAPDFTARDASYRVLLGIIMSICWSIVIVF